MAHVWTPLIAPQQHGRCHTCGHAVKDFYFPQAGQPHVNELLQHHFYLRSLKFLPALLLTLVLEMINGGFLQDNADWLTNHFILVVFIPVISAIAGNIGLQTSSSVTAYLNVYPTGDPNRRPAREIFHDIFYAFFAERYFIESYDVIYCVYLGCNYLCG